MRKDEIVKAVCLELKTNGTIADFTYDHFDESDAIMPPYEKLDAAEIFYQLTADTAYIESEDFYESLYEL